MHTEEAKQYTVGDVKEILREYREFEKYIDMMIVRIDRIEMKLKSIGSPSLTGMPRDPSPSQSREADLVCLKVDLENEVKDSLDELKKKREKIKKIVAKLRHPEEKAVILMRYIDGLEWGDVLDAMFGDKEDFLEKEETYNRRMYQRHGSALLNMSRILTDRNNQT